MSKIVNLSSSKCLRSESYYLDSNVPFEGADELSNWSDNLNDDCDDTDTALESDSIDKEVTDKNTFAKDNSKEVQTSLKKSNQVYFSCDLCNRKFNSKHQLRLHKDSKCGSVKFFGCNICTKGFTTKTALKGHVMRCHMSGETSKFKCDVCYKVCKSEIILLRHKSRHNVPNNIETQPQTCEYCQKLFSRRYLLKDHVKRIHDSPQQFECAHCSKVFKSRKGIESHMQAHHIPGRKKYTSNKCKERAGMTRSRRSIVNKKTPNNPKPTVCHQVSDGEQKLYITSSPSTNLESLSVDLSLEMNKNKCSVEPGLICSKPQKVNDTPQSLRNNDDPFKEAYDSSNFSGNVSYDCGDTNTTLESDSIGMEVTDKNTFAADNSKEVQTSLKNVSKKRNQVYFSCDLCNRKFNKKNLLRMHKDSKCGSLKSFGCNICTKGFTTKTALTGHVMRCHMSGETSTLKCDVCDKVYTYEKSLLRHKSRHNVPNNIETQPQTCEYCQKVFSRRDLLKDHVKRVHVSPQQFECAHCSKVFKYRFSIQSHMLFYHIQDGRTCTTCRHTFSCENELHNHTMADNCSRKKYICDHCGKAFKGKHTLSNHLLTHSGEKPFICQTCGKHFRTETNLVQHSVTHSDVRPFSCDICSKSFRIRNHLKQHMSVHGVVNSVAKQTDRNNKNLNDIKN